MRPCATPTECNASATAPRAQRSNGVELDGAAAPHARGARRVRSPTQRDNDSSQDRPATGKSRADRAPAGRAAPSTRAYQVAFFFLLFCGILVLPGRVDRVVCRGWHPHFPPVAWCVCSSCGVFASFYATRSRPPDRRGRSSRRLYEGLYIYVMHRLYTQGLVVGILWSGAPDVVARATQKRSALELGARPTGNWRRGAAGLNSLGQESRGGLRRSGARSSWRSARAAGRWG